MDKLTLPVTCYQLKWILYLAMLVSTIWSSSVFCWTCTVNSSTPIMVIQGVLTILGIGGSGVGTIIVIIYSLDDLPIKCRCKK